MLKLLKNFCLLILLSSLVSGCGGGVSVYNIKENIDIHSSELSGVPKVVAFERFIEIVQGVHERDNGAGFCQFSEDGIHGGLADPWDGMVDDPFLKFEELAVYTYYAERKNTGFIDYGPGYVLKFYGWESGRLHCEIGGMSKQEIDDAVKALSIIGIHQIGY